MKKLLALVLATLMMAGVLSGCTAPPPEKSSDASKTQASSPSTSVDHSANSTSLKVVLLVSGSLGDKSFFDAANAGMQQAKNELGAEIKVIEMGTDKTKYEPTFRDICAQDWDLIISGGPEMTDIFSQCCPEFPDKHFMNYDVSDSTAVPGVYGVAYSANDLCYLAGALAALCTTSGIPEMNPDAKIGFIGGMDIPGINDFLVGYIQGAKDTNADIKIAISYAQDFANPGKGKELAINQYNSGADIVFSAAGGTGLGVLDAASEKGLYAIGVDSDQAMMFKDTDAKKAAQIITSAVKRVDQAVFNAIKQYQSDGTLPFGEFKMLGIKEDGVGLAYNEYYDQIVPAEIKAKIAEIEQKLANGEIEVPTAIGMEQSTLDALRNSVKP
jgi:basic membrane lipoprotein